MLNIIYISGVKLGYDCMSELLNMGYNVKHVFSLSDEFSERSGYTDFSPLCKKYGISLTKTHDINLPENVESIRKANPDVIFVIGWSQIIGDDILKIPRIGVIGHHPTLLPKHRGNAPIPWTLINGLTKSGITFFFLEKTIDEGDIILQKEFDITLDDDASSLYDKATNATIEGLRELLPLLENNTYVRKKQDPKRASYWKKRKPEDSIIEWNSMTIHLYNWIRGLSHPYPGAFTFLGEKKLFIWKCKLAALKKDLLPGTLWFEGGRVFVSTGDGTLEISSLQFEGEKEMSAKEFIDKYGDVNMSLLG